jgi:hypothetical protein
MTTMRVIVVVLGMTTLFATLRAAPPRTSRLPEDPRDVPREAQLAVVQTSADLDADGRHEALLTVNALTGEPDPARGSEVIFGIAQGAPKGERGALLWTRHVLAETGRPAHDGDMTAVDLDGDGHIELILTWDRSLSADRTERWGEVYVIADPARPRRVWEGVWETDTRRDKGTPESQKQWNRREVDYRATRGEAGQAIVFRITRHVEGGLKVEPPRSESEWAKVALRAAAPR